MTDAPTNTEQTVLEESPLQRTLTTGEAAQYLRLKPSTLNKWRSYGGGPEFVKLGRAVRYRREDLDAFLAAHRLSSTASY